MISDEMLRMARRVHIATGACLGIALVAALVAAYVVIADRPLCFARDAVTVCDCEP